METIDLRSDTVTQPTPEMRRAMAEAAVGDDVYRDDPTTNELETMAAGLLGYEEALFVPSGTMSNQLALMSHTQRGDEVILGKNSHIVWHEVGAAAVLSGVNVRTLDFRDDIPSPAAIEKAIRPADIHEPPTALICLENALSSGRVVPESVMGEVAAVAKAHSLPVHLDGARIFNAAVALGVDVKALTRHADSLSCCLSKGLCAPVGSVLCGSSTFIARARKYRKMLGGGMRQTGILAAAGILALTEMPKRLEKDHLNAREMAAALAQLPGVEVDMGSVQINMVHFTLHKDAALIAALPEKLAERGILVNAADGDDRMRFVTHYGIDAADVRRVCTTMAALLA